ncbi:hypothetical protein JCM1841_004481 [Sporobolomyces salmonicolor]
MAEASTSEVQCAPEGEAHYTEWDPKDHLEHRQYDSTHTLEGQDPAEKEHYEHIMHDPHKPLDAKLNAADALEALPHCQQNVDVEGFRETD